MWHFITYCLEIFYEIHILHFSLYANAYESSEFSTTKISLSSNTILGDPVALCLTQSMNTKIWKLLLFRCQQVSMTNPSLSVRRLCQSLEQLNNALEFDVWTWIGCQDHQPIQWCAMTFTNTKFNSAIQIKAKRSRNEGDLNFMRLYQN